MHVSLQGGFELGDTVQELHMVSGHLERGPKDGSVVGAVQLAVDGVSSRFLAGGFLDLGYGVTRWDVSLGARAGVQLAGTLKVLGEVGVHGVGGLGGDPFSDSDVPVVGLPFGGFRIECAPLRRFASPLLALGVRKTSVAPRPPVR